MVWTFGGTPNKLNDSAHPLQWKDTFPNNIDWLLVVWNWCHACKRRLIIKVGRIHIVYNEIRALLGNWSKWHPLLHNSIFIYIYVFTFGKFVLGEKKMSTIDRKIWFSEIYWKWWIQVPKTRYQAYVSFVHVSISNSLTEERSISATENLSISVVSFWSFLKIHAELNWKLHRTEYF